MVDLPQSKKYVSLYSVFFEILSERSIPTYEEKKRAWDEFRKRDWDSIDADFESLSEIDADD